MTDGERLQIWREMNRMFTPRVFYCVDCGHERNWPVEQVADQGECMECDRVNVPCYKLEPDEWWRLSLRRPS